MAVTLFQRLRLWWRGASRRREQRDRDFLARNASWTADASGSGATRPELKSPAAETGPSIDLEGLQSAWLDQSGRFAYYLDVETGDVVDVRDGQELEPPRFRRVPSPSDDEDRRAFLASLDTDGRERIGRAASFRAGLATDRALERAWYNFRNHRAAEGIQRWLVRDRD